MLEPVTVIVAEFEGDLSLAAPLLQPNDEDALLLSRDEAREFFHYNGRSYYEKPKLYKLEWRLQIPADGEYTVEAMLRAGNESQMVELDINGVASRHQIPAGYSGGEPATWALATYALRAGEDLTLSLTPPKPFEKGTALGLEAEDIRLVPVQ